MTTVYTKEELQKAIKRKEFPISCRGEIAEQLKKRKKRSKAAKLGGAAVVIAGLAALPFTGGASAGAAAMGLTATAAATAAATVGISAAELAILVGGGVAIFAILKGRKVRLEKDGSVTVE